jgi:deoxyribose-phosphate aldolase
MNVRELASYIDFTLLRPEAAADDFRVLAEAARRWAVYAVCVPPSRVVLARHLLEDTTIKVCTVAGFPLGHNDADSKRFEVEAAVDNGAHEIDVVMNVGLFKDGDETGVLRELRDVVEAADERPVKVILETGLLERSEIESACRLVIESEADFVKTSTGFGPRGATVADVRLIRETVGPKFGVKAAGGIRDLETMRAMLDAGANRIGTSAAVAILEAAQHPPVL